MILTKKHIVLLMSLVLVTLLFGCSNKPEDTNINENNSLSEENDVTFENDNLSEDVVLDETIYFESENEVDKHYSYQGKLFFLDELLADYPDKSDQYMCVYSSRFWERDENYILVGLYGSDTILFEGKMYAQDDDVPLFHVVGNFVEKKLEFPYIGLNYPENDYNFSFSCAEHYVCSIGKNPPGSYHEGHPNFNMVFPEEDFEFLSKESIEKYYEQGAKN